MMRRNRFAMVTAAGCLLLLLWGLSQQLYSQRASRTLELKVIEQIRDNACGLACLVSVLDYWDVDTKQRELLRLHPPDRGSKGYTLGRLKRIAQKKDLNGYALYTDLSFLRKQISKGRPVMVALLVPYNVYSLQIVREIPVYGEFFKFLTQATTYSHFVVVRSVRNKEIRVMDPLHGLKTLPRDAFRAMWDKMDNAALLVGA